MYISHFGPLENSFRPINTANFKDCYHKKINEKNQINSTCMVFLLLGHLSTFFFLCHHLNCLLVFSVVKKNLLLAIVNQTLIFFNGIYHNFVKKTYFIIFYFYILTDFL